MTLAARLLTAVDLTLPGVALLLLAAFVAGWRACLYSQHHHSTAADRQSIHLQEFERRNRMTAP